MSHYTYTDDQRVIFSHYLDVSDPENVTTLVPEPGKTYEIKQADSPRLVQTDGQFTDQELPMPPSDAFAETSEPTWLEVEAREAAKQQAAVTPPPAKPAPAAKKKEQADA